jgi:hypothetical protein
LAVPFDPFDRLRTPPLRVRLRAGFAAKGAKMRSVGARDERRAHTDQRKSE